MHVYSWMRAMVDMDWHVTYIYYASDLPFSHTNELAAELRAHGIRVVGPCPQHEHFLRRFLVEENFDAIFENFWANLVLFTFNLNFNKIIHERGLDTKIVMVAHDEMSKRSKQEGDAENAANFAILERFLRHSVDLIATVSGRMQLTLLEDRIEAACAKTSSLRFTYDYVYGQKVSKERLKSDDDASSSWDARSGISFLAANNPANTNSLRFICQSISPTIDGEDVWVHVFGSVVLPIECDARGRVKHHGVIGEDDVETALSKSRWLVLPCLSSVGVSTKLVKALSVSTPVMSTALCTQNMPGGDDDDASTGFPVLVLELDKFSQQFTRYFNDKDLWMNLYVHSVPYYNDNFSKSAVQKNILEISQQLGLRRMAFEVAKSSTKKPTVVIWDVSKESASSFSSLNNAKHALDGNPDFVLEEPDERRCEDAAAIGDASADIYVQWIWPVRLSRPKCCPKGKCTLIYVIAWEMGHLPKVWVDFFIRNVDVIWTLSEYNANMFLTAKIDENRVRILPLGVNCSLENNSTQLSQQLRALQSQIPESSSVFLYVGGALPRKALDVILKSWCEAFTRTANVVLVMKITYVHGGDDILNEIERLSRNSSTCAKLFVVREFIEDITSLYAIADVLVHPARAEGFGLTPLEALSHGLVVIYNEFGATSEFLSTEYAIRTESRKETCTVWPCRKQSFCVFPNKAKNQWDACEELQDKPFWFTPNTASLTANLLDAHQNLRTHRERAKFGKEIACEHFSWIAVGDAVERELNHAREIATSSSSSLNSRHSSWHLSDGRYDDSAVAAAIGKWDWKRMQR